MAKPDLIYLVHRMPYPPDKGDKIRSYHILQHLLRHYRVHLGCFVDDPRDMQHLGTLQELCASVFVRPLRPLVAKALSARAFLSGGALSVVYYRDAGFRNWVSTVLEEKDIRAAVVFSSPMAQYLRGRQPFARIMDFVDVDSDKWQQYADSKRGLARWFYGREARKLLTFEREIAEEFDASVFVSPHETDLFSEIAPSSRDRHYAICNGVDYGYFDPDIDQENPFEKSDRPIVFTGMMDYWPNIDAVAWFATEVFPLVRQEQPDASFWIVGGAPTQEVKDLARLPGVTVTGRVPDVRPYLKSAAVVVAPLRVARGIQNKVLEALSMGKPVVCTSAAAAGLENLPADAVWTTDKPEELAANIRAAGSSNEHKVRQAARGYVIDQYDWQKNLALIDSLLGGHQR